MSYTCEKCNFSTEFKQSYEKHLETTLHKTGKRKIRSDKKILDKCPYCLYTTKDITCMKLHTVQHLPWKERKKEYKYICEYCEWGGFSISQHEKHITAPRHLNKLKYLGIS